MLCIQIRLNDSAIVKNTAGQVFRIEVVQVKEGYKCKVRVSELNLNTGKDSAAKIYDLHVRQQEEDNKQAIERVAEDIYLGEEVIQLINNGKSNRKRVAGQDVLMGFIAPRTVKIVREKHMLKPNFSWDYKKGGNR